MVKLKCVDNCGVKYITKGKIYEAKKIANLKSVYVPLDDTNANICVSIDDRNAIHGKWGVVS